MLSVFHIPTVDITTRVQVRPKYIYYILKFSTQGASSPVSFVFSYRDSVAEGVFCVCGVCFFF